MREPYTIFEKFPKRKVAVLTMNRPEKLNAATTDDWLEVKQRVQEVNTDEDVKVLIIKGAGRCFGSGMDVLDLGPHHGWSPDPKARRPSQRRRFVFDKHVFWGKDGMLQTILTCDKATIAQVHGYCYGGHHEMALACDIVIAAEDARFVHPGYRYIGPLGQIGLFFLTMGVRKTKEMMLTGRPLTAPEALECGLINKVLPLEKLEDEVNQMADIIGRQPFDAIVMGKCFFEATMDAMGIAAGNTLAYIGHTLQTNIRYEPDEFNLFNMRGKRGLKGAFAEREQRFKDAPLA